MKILIAAIALLSILSPAHALFWSRKYPVKLERQLRVGMKLRNVVKIETKAMTQSGKEKPKVVQEIAELEYTMRVLEMKSKHWHQIEVVISKLRHNGKLVNQQFGPINQPVIVTRHARKVTFLRRGGAPLRAVEEKFLAPFFPSPAAVGLDETLGTGEKVKEGAVWAVDQGKLAHQLFESSGKALAVNENDISGRMKLAKVWKVKGQRQLQFWGQVNFKNVKAKSLKLRALENAKATAKLEVTLHLPTDLSRPAARMKQIFAWQLSGELVKKTLKRQFALKNQTTMEQTSELLQDSPKKGAQ